jgi:hypothetical protein
MEKAIVDSLTVEFSRVPGKTFHRKVLSKLSWFFRKFVRLFLSEIISLWRFSFCGGAPHKMRYEAREREVEMHDSPGLSNSGA